MGGFKNASIRKALCEHGLKQYHLANILGCTPSAVSVMMNYELTKKEQREIIEKIKEATNAQ